MDGERSGGGGAEVEDEFACAGMLRSSLTSLHATVERIFSVSFGIGADDHPHSNNGQIWLKLGGRSHNVKAAKLFVKGVVNQEEQQEVSYPEVLHCVFCGAKGLFMDCLIRSTSAHILIGSPGFLLISGLAEPVVRAYSLITDLLERYKGTQARRPESEERGPAESLELRRAFKALVEGFEDRHVLDLLVLPVSVKEVLLDLVQEAGLVPGAAGPAPGGFSEDRWGVPAVATHTPPDVEELATPLSDARGRAEGAEEEAGERVSAATALGGPGASTGNKEFSLLSKFFTAMGYTEDVVKRVLARTGLKEASKILDLVQQEQDCSDKEHMQRRPCETEHREEGEVEGGGARGGGEESFVWLEDREAGLGEREAGPEEDFVLGVLTKAAVSCGYKEQEVAKVYSMLPERSTHQLLLELQREADAPREEPRETDDLVPVSDESWGSGGSKGGWLQLADRLPHHPDGQLAVRPKKQPPPRPQPAEQATPPEVKGPPMPTYPPYATVNAPASKQSRPSQDHHASAEGVTGEQRFLEGLQMPFDLQLTGKPGDPGLRAIIIDGSNVAMSHGLSHFFSCRGIALAVQHFWDRGHRNICTFLPQWRKKTNPLIKERHYLDKLEDLGLLSYTPSREVQGRRISSYDDRFMLQRAEKTHGVIVTNDNLRDLVEESEVWANIIKTSLLQYTFVGDHFMVPDDPLGRGGPHLDHFLRTQHGTPNPGSHSLRGGASALTASRAPRPHSEPLPFRDRMPIGVTEITGRGRGRGHGRGHWRGHGRGRDLGQGGDGGGAGPPERTAEETRQLREQLCQVFPGQEAMVTLVLQCHPAEADVNALSHLLLEQQAD